MRSRLSSRRPSAPRCSTVCCRYSAQLPPGPAARVSQYTTDDEAMLEHIVGRGFALGAEVVVMARDPFDGPLTVRVAGDERVIGAGVAGCILVEEGQGT